MQCLCVQQNAIAVIAFGHDIDEAPRVLVLKGFVRFPDHVGLLRAKTVRNLY